MSQEQNYQVNYAINVQASEGTAQVIAFANAVGKLVQAKLPLTGAVQNIQKMMAEIDATFRTKGGRKRDYSYKINIDTTKSEEKLERIKNVLSEIKEMSKGINLAINSGAVLDSKALKAKSKSLIDKKLVDGQNDNIRQSAASSVKIMQDTQKSITKVVGKINASLISLEKGREVNIKTDVAEQRLQGLLTLMQKIKSAANIPFNMPVGTTTSTAQSAYTPSASVNAKLQEKLYTNNQLFEQKRASALKTEEDKLLAAKKQYALRMSEFEQKQASSLKTQADKMFMAEKQHASRIDEWNRQRSIRQADAEEKRIATDQKRAERDTENVQKRTATQAISNTREKLKGQISMQSNRRKGAINRLQYANAPSLQNLPMMSMVNGYMAYGLMRSELTKAIEYSNIMESAQSILKVSDGELTTFENRFDSMARYVRQIGVETKFTAVEIAGAVKYLSMAGMGIDTINKSIRPITNLALIGDNDVSQIADLATNIMAGYDVKNNSMGSVADILASTVSRSNVNIIEMAESFKMSAGYLRMAGVEFSESSAAIGILGNMGIKGTMAGTALRAMSTRFAKPTKESQGVLDRLGVKFTEHRDVYGKKVEKFRPLANIFEDLDKKGATMGDMQSIFGKIGGNAAMMFVRNHEKLREMTVHNRGSYGISSELAKVKQDTTKGLWAQVTSQFTESFMKGYETIEPIIKSTLRDLLSKFNSPEFSQGIASIGQSILNVVSVLGKLGAWVTRNFHWIEPMIFSGFVATKLYKLAGALTNVGIAVGFLGKKSAANSIVNLIGGLTGGGGGGIGGIGKVLSFANKRSIVTAMQAAGVAGKGAMTRSLLGAGGGALTARTAAMSMFSSQVATGTGLIGSTASIGALGTTAVVATAGIAALVGALGWVAYKTWKVKEAKDAVLEEIESNRKYRYPSIDALHLSLSNTYKMALDTKKAIGELTGRTIEDVSGQKIGAFTGNWWTAVISSFGAAQARGNGLAGADNLYSFRDAYQNDTRNAIQTLAKKDSQARINSAYADLGTKKTAIEVGAFIQNVHDKYGQSEKSLDKSLWTTNKDGEVIYKKGMDKLLEKDVVKTFHYGEHMNKETVPEIIRMANIYRDAISTTSGAQSLMGEGDFNFKELTTRGFSMNKDNKWEQSPLAKNATDQDREDQLANNQFVHDRLVKFTASLRNTFGGSAHAAENILNAAGFPSHLFSNEPDSNDKQPFNENDIMFSGEPSDPWGWGSRGKGWSSGAPKQVIVNITNLLSIETIELLKSPEGQAEEMQNLKEKMAQVLIDVVHDFDASWNG